MLIQPLDSLKYVYGFFSLFLSKINCLSYLRPTKAFKQSQIHDLNFAWTMYVGKFQCQRLSSTENVDPNARAITSRYGG